MRIRPYQPSDLPDILTWSPQGKFSDTLAMYLTREPERFPNSYKEGIRRFLRDASINPGESCWVVVNEPGDTPTTANNARPAPPPNTALGLAFWHRMGKSETAKKWQRANATWGHAVERVLNKAEAAYYLYYPGARPSWNKESMKVIEPLLHEPWEPSIFDECWELDLLAVDEDWHRQGAGSLLVQWGLQQAGKENVPAIVSSSVIGYRTYEKNGFKPMKRFGFDQYFEVGGNGMWRLVWEPPGRQGNWLERAKEWEEDRKVREAAEKEKKEGKKS